jgi:hypothetical protein
LHLPDGTSFGTVAAIDRLARTVDVKKRGAQADALFAHSVTNSDVAVRFPVTVLRDFALTGTSCMATLLMPLPDSDFDPTESG